MGGTGAAATSPISGLSRHVRLLPLFAFGASLLAMAVLIGRLDSGPARLPPEVRPGSIVAVMQGSAEGFERAFEPRVFQFPLDHGPHPAFRTEWWYVTGNLVGRRPSAEPHAEPREFGFQLTFFRFALAPQTTHGEVDRDRAEQSNSADNLTPRSEPASAWSTRQVYMAHAALTDLGTGVFYSDARVQRGALALAGARSAPFAVWLRDWSLRSIGGDAAAADPFPLQLEAFFRAHRLALTIQSAKPVVLQGQHGLSPKSETPGNASYYYSYTRLPVHGRIAGPDGIWQVSGHGWLDREWSTSALDPNQTGWDWFALQLSDGRELMFYRIRERTESGEAISRTSSGVLVERDGRYRSIPLEAITLRPLAFWTSPRSAARYPVQWSLVLRMPDFDVSNGRAVTRRSSAAPDLALTLRARLDDQEHQGTFRYWEGSISVQGRAAGVPVTGLGYLEMTGYDMVLDAR